MKIVDIDFTFFCTGARNQSLIKCFNPKNLSFEIDERSASFRALGYAKFSQKPVAICTTSGTAVSECLSAMVEAYYSESPILLVTGDRPIRMRNTGAPQTIDHELITRGYRRSYIECDEEEFKNIDLTKIKYPAHINVLIENLHEKIRKNNNDYENSWDGFELFLKNNPRPLFLITHESIQMRTFVQNLSEFKIPFYAECLSQAHDLTSIKYEQTLMRSIENNEFTSIIRVGHTPLSKVWRQMERYHLPVFSFDSRGLTGLSYGSVLSYRSQELIDHPLWIKNLSQIQPFHINENCNHKFLELIDRYPHSEISMLSKIESLIPEESMIYLGNSLCIRFFEIVQTKNFLTYGNRGVNGIDGQLSTAIGLARACKKNVYCFLGDLTTQYDLSALKDLPENLKLIIINNFGGRIFETLKMPGEFILSHDFHFKKIAHAFDLTYENNNLENFENVQVFEINPDNISTMEFLKKWEI
jgi:2-succinyl-5-enolpyruvyl-6-hydroxy-3-cyclohexene-1-carboxylate synthase